MIAVVVTFFGEGWESTIAVYSESKVNATTEGEKVWC